MDVNKLSRILKTLVTDTHAYEWSRTSDKSAYCLMLVGSNHDHPIITTILSDVLNNLLAYRAKSLTLAFKTPT
jgi:hypothetical protein